MSYHPGLHDFFQEFRGMECIVVYSAGDLGDWYIAPLNDDGSEGDPIESLTLVEQELLSNLIAKEEQNRHA